MNEPKDDRNPDELQEVYLTDEQMQQRITNYLVMQDLENFDPDSMPWELMNKDDKKGDDIQPK